MLDDISYAFLHDNLRNQKRKEMVTVKFCSSYHYRGKRDTALSEALLSTANTVPTPIKGTPTIQKFLF